jgi:Helicase associated domain
MATRVVSAAQSGTRRYADVGEVLLRLEQFRGRYGHLYVPDTYRCGDGFRLGTWCGRRRREYRRGRLGPRYEVLHGLPGWDWEAKHWRLIEGLQRLTLYVEAFGSADVPYGYECEDGFRLGYWVKNRRRLLWKQPWLAEILLAMPGWRTSRRVRSRPRLREERGPTSREVALEHLWVFVCEHGHARPPGPYSCGDGYRLGRWVKWRRSQHGQDGVMDALLESLPGWTWSANDLAFDEWLERFELASSSGCVKGDLRLRRWIRRQREAAARGKLSASRAERLRRAGVLGFAPACLSGGKHVHGVG